MYEEECDIRVSTENSVLLVTQQRWLQKNLTLEAVFTSFLCGSTKTLFLCELEAGMQHYNCWVNSLWERPGKEVSRGEKQLSLSLGWGSAWPPKSHRTNSNSNSLQQGSLYKFQLIHYLALTISSIMYSWL